MSRSSLLAALASLLGVAAALAANTPAEVTFSDVTAAAGLSFRHVNGAFGKKYLPETMGSGVAFLDADGDGWQDIYFVQSTRWPGRADAPSLPALYRNNRNGTFTDVTRASGLAQTSPMNSFSSPAMTRNSVLLPEPLTPRMPIFAPQKKER